MNRFPKPETEKMCVGTPAVRGNGYRHKLVDVCEAMEAPAAASSQRHERVFKPPMRARQLKCASKRTASSS